MQDRFKFRVWDTKLNEYVKLDDRLIMFQDYRGKLYLSRTPGWTFDDLKRVEDNRYIVEQCIGLRDKNGKLIYEGDILKVSEFGKPVEVRFKAIGFVLRREPSNTPGYENDKYIPEDSEVIGNIYENKELLNE